MSPPKAIDRALNRYAPWSYTALVLGAAASGVLVKLGLLDVATGLATNMGLFGLGMSGLMAFLREREATLLKAATPQGDDEPSITFFPELDKEVRALEKMAKDSI